MKKFLRPAILLPICTLLCFAGLIGSFLIPNKVLDTVVANMSESEDDKEEVIYFTSESDEFAYVFTTEDRPLKGFQIGIDKRGQSLDGFTLSYRVYALEDEKAEVGTAKDPESAADTEKAGANIPERGEMLYQGSYSLSECMDGQYPYLPMEGDALKGRVMVTFSIVLPDSYVAIDPAGMPGVFVNHGSANDAVTYFNGEKAGYLLKTQYVYSHDTFPFLYDFRIMLFVFLAVSALAVPAFGKARIGEDVDKNDDENETTAKEEAKGGAK